MSLSFILLPRLTYLFWLVSSQQPKGPSPSEEEHTSTAVGMLEFIQSGLELEVLQ